MDDKKMLNIFNHLGNANQNHNEIPLYTPQDGYNLKKRGNHSVREDVKSEPSYTAGENVKY